jgi:hypothetical protein
MYEDARDKESCGHRNQQAIGGDERQPASPKRILTVCCAPLDALIKEGSLELTNKTAWLLYDNNERSFPAHFCPFCGRPLCEVRPVEKDVRGEDGGEGR